MKLEPRGIPEDCVELNLIVSSDNFIIVNSGEWEIKKEFTPKNIEQFLLNIEEEVNALFTLEESTRIPSLATKDVKKTLLKNGFKILKGKAKGSHTKFKNDENITLTVPLRKNGLGKGLLVKIIKDSGISFEEFGIV